MKQKTNKVEHVHRVRIKRIQKKKNYKNIKPKYCEIKKKSTKNKR